MPYCVTHMSVSLWSMLHVLAFPYALEEHACLCASLTSLCGISLSHTDGKRWLCLLIALTCVTDKRPGLWLFVWHWPALCLETLSNMHDNQPWKNHVISLWFLHIFSKKPPPAVAIDMDEETQLQIALSLSKEEHQQVWTSAGMDVQWREINVMNEKLNSEKNSTRHVRRTRACMHELEMMIIPSVRNGGGSIRIWSCWSALPMKGNLTGAGSQDLFSSAKK